MNVSTVISVSESANDTAYAVISDITSRGRRANRGTPFGRVKWSAHTVLQWSTR